MLRNIFNKIIITISLMVFLLSGCFQANKIELEGNVVMHEKNISKDSIYQYFVNELPSKIKIENTSIYDMEDAPINHNETNSSFENLLKGGFCEEKICFVGVIDKNLDELYGILKNICARNDRFEKIFLYVFSSNGDYEEFDNLENCVNHKLYLFKNIEN